MSAGMPCLVRLWLTMHLVVLVGGVAAQTVPDMPMPSAAPPAPTRPTEAARKAEQKAAQRAQEKRDADRRIAEAVAQAERERLAREKVETEKRRVEAEVAELARRTKSAEQARSVAAAAAAAAAVAAVAAAPATLSAPSAPSTVARHPHMGEPLAARQTFVDYWGQGTSRVTAPRMVVIAPAPVGGFVMGSPPEERGRDWSEKQHRVSIDYVFALSETEITFAQWNTCVADGGCDRYRSVGGAGRDQYPIVNVSWHAARAYTDWLNNRLRLDRNDPYRYRLPSEAEWEYAARAGNGGPFGFAQNKPIAPELANYDSRTSYQGGPTRDWMQGSTPVGSYPANPFGLKDMLGNVWEWVADCYDPDYHTPRDGSAHRESDLACPARVVRGGSWFFAPDALRVTKRFWSAPTYHDNKGGFRIARMLMPRS